MKTCIKLLILMGSLSATISAFAVQSTETENQADRIKQLQGELAGKKITSKLIQSRAAGHISRPVSGVALANNAEDDELINCVAFYGTHAGPFFSVSGADVVAGVVSGLYNILHNGANPAGLSVKCSNTRPIPSQLTISNIAVPSSLTASYLFSYNLTGKTHYQNQNTTVQTNGPNNAVTTTTTTTNTVIESTFNNYTDKVQSAW